MQGKFRIQNCFTMKYITCVETPFIHTTLNVGSIVIHVCNRNLVTPKQVIVGQSLAILFMRPSALQLARYSDTCYSLWLIRKACKVLCKHGSEQSGVAVSDFLASAQVTATSLLLNVKELPKKFWGFFTAEIEIRILGCSDKCRAEHIFWFCTANTPVTCKLSCVCTSCGIHGQLEPPNNRGGLTPSTILCKLNHYSIWALSVAGNS